MRTISDELAEKVEKAFGAVRGLINESTGVAGLHLNGDVAPWDELEEGGRYEEWLATFAQAVDAWHAEKCNPQNTQYSR